MNEAERRAWLETLSDPQIMALMRVAGLYHMCPKASRGTMLESLSLVEEIEVPERVQ